ALLATTEADELLDPALSAEELLYRLYHEDGVRVFKPAPLRAECSCNAEKIAAVLERYDESELADMVEDGFIRVSCEFCRRDYLFDRAGRLVAA
ncbi:MAG TPA: Hsp33 family molecular chaperone HslO, partial [Parvularculaceae bacterium]|nr:Hsp33 family molecular chaperone HslO [Parvularculaceae bacterium]